MSERFNNLSREGKIAKISQHVGDGHPVPSEWVGWLVSEFVPQEVWPSSPERVEDAFQGLSNEKKLEKLAGSLKEGLIPSSWVEWLSDEFVMPKNELASTPPGP